MSFCINKVNAQYPSEENVNLKIKVDKTHDRLIDWLI